MSSHSLKSAAPLHASLHLCETARVRPACVALITTSVWFSKFVLATFLVTGTSFLIRRNARKLRLILPTVQGVKELKAQWQGFEAAGPTVCPTARSRKT